MIIYITIILIPAVLIQPANAVASSGSFECNYLLAHSPPIPPKNHETAVNRDQYFTQPIGAGKEILT